LQWWEWHKKSSKNYIAWSQFVTILLERFERFERDTHDLGILTKLFQINLVTEFILDFEKLSIRIENLNDYFYKECFISVLIKEEI